METPTSPIEKNDKIWLGFWRWGTVALVFLALFWPLSMLAWARISWEWGETVYIWKGDEVTGSLPRLKEISIESTSWLRYLWYTIAAEQAATRWWTSVVAVLGGVLMLTANGIRHPRTEGLLTWFAWCLAGLGLIAIGLDERFQIHEWVRVLVFKPAGIADDTSWLNPGDVATLIYPLGAFIVWRTLFKSLAGDRFAQFCLIAVLPIGLLAIGIDVLDIDALDRYPGWVYGGVIEEFAEWEVVALMAVVSWRRIAMQLKKGYAG